MADKLKSMEYMDLALKGIAQCKEIYPNIIKLAYHEAGGDYAHVIVYSCLAEALRECIAAMSDAMRSTVLDEKQDDQERGQR